jgi:hypothetical protein
MCRWSGTVIGILHQPPWMLKASESHCSNVSAPIVNFAEHSAFGFGRVVRSVESPMELARRHKSVLSLDTTTQAFVIDPTSEFQ